MIGLKIRVHIPQIIDVLFFIYILSIYVFSFVTGLNSFCKIIALVLAVSLVVKKIVKKEKTMIIDPSIVVLVLFLLFCILSSVWAVDKSLVFDRAVTLFENIALLLLLFDYFETEKKIGVVIECLAWAGALYCIYVVLFYGVNEYMHLLLSGSRIGGEITNVNRIGLVSSKAALIFCWFVIYKEKYWYAAPGLLCFIVALGTGSRKVLLTIVVGLILLYILKGRSVQKLKSLLKIVLILFLLYWVIKLPWLDVMEQRITYAFNFLTGKGQTDKSMIERSAFIKMGLETFLDKPFTGIGAGNTGYITVKYSGGYTYLHNNYVELLASVGLFGTILYYLAYFFPIKKLFKRSLGLDSFAILALTLIVTTLVLQIGVVDYFEKTTYLYFLLFLLAQSSSDTYEKESL